LEHPRRFNFYKLRHYYTTFHPTFCTLSDIINFNKSLPNEIIVKILSMLSGKDLLCLSISKMFLPVLLNSPDVFFKINQYLLHLLGEYFHNKENLFIQCTLIPIIYNNNFYFSIHKKKIKYFKHLYSNYSLFSHILSNFPAMTLSYAHFKTHWNKQFTLTTGSNCLKSCFCKFCYFKPQPYSSNPSSIFLQRTCCSVHV